MTDPAQNPAVIEVTNEITSLESFAANYAVTTPAQYEAGAADLARVKGMLKKLEETRTSITGPMNAALDKVNAFFKGPATKLKAIEQLIKGKLGAFYEDQQRIAREQQAKADEDARKERERIEAQAKKAAESGKVEKAEALQQRAATVVAPVIVREPPKVSGMQMRDAWKFEVTNPSLVPREYLVVDEARIRKVVQALKGDANIPGVRVYSEKQIASSAA
jgi:hypothetical protein